MTVAIAPFAVSQITPTPDSVEAIDGTPVMLAGEELFVIQTQVGSFSAAERARAVTQRIERFANNTNIPVTALRVDDGEYSTKY